MADKLVPTYNINDRNGIRDGGPYNDQEELILAEKRRAAVEGREPNYDKLLPTAGVPVVTEAQLHNLSDTTLVPGDLPTPVGETIDPIKAFNDAHKETFDTKTDDGKVAAAQAKAIEKDEKPIDSIEVTKAVVSE